MQKLLRFKNPPVILATGTVGGYEEGRGPLGGKFDHIDATDRFGMPTWERAEGEMQRLALNFALNKVDLPPDKLDVLLAGDLQNQCVASSGGLYTFGIPYLGLYAACSTAAEGLLLLSLLLSSGKEIKLGAAVTSSHNAAAERQFRTPLEYGGQRAKTAQWTATAAGAFLLGSDLPGKVKITDGMIGRVVDGAISDGANMGPAMAPAAADTILAYFRESGKSLSDFDAVVTGDLGEVGSALLEELVGKDLPHFKEKHRDCGLILYDRKLQDVHAGASGCGCSATVLANYFIPALEEGAMRDILFLATGALMSPSSVAQGEHIFGIAPLVHLSTGKGEKIC